MSAGSPVPPVPVPDELSRAPAGALLAGLLEDIDVQQVCGHDTVEVLCAHYRRLCRQTAQFYQAVLETGLRRPFSIDTVDRVVQPGEFAAEEARAALVWSRSRAERALSFAVEVFDRLPLLGEAMLAGELDEPRARAFIDWTAGLIGEHAHQVCRQLVPGAARVTVGELIERIKRACLAVDPRWAENKYRAAVRTRRVRGFLGPDGTGTLSGQCQPAERVIAACERIDALARACKRAGDGRAIDLIRSDLFLGMTDGTLEGLTEPEIIAHVLAHPYVLPGEDGDTSDPSGRSTGGSDDDNGDAHDGGGDGGGGSDNGGPDDGSPDDGVPAGGPDDDGSPDDGLSPRDDPAGGPGVGGGSPRPGEPGAEPAAGVSAEPAPASLPAAPRCGGDSPARGGRCPNYACR